MKTRQIELNKLEEFMNSKEFFTVYPIPKGMIHYEKIINDLLSFCSQYEIDCESKLIKNVSVVTLSNEKDREFINISKYFASINHYELEIFNNTKEIFQYIKEKKYRYYILFMNHTDISWKFQKKIKEVQDELIENNFPFYYGFFVGYSNDNLLFNIIKDHVYSKTNFKKNLAILRTDYDNKNINDDSELTTLNFYNSQIDNLLDKCDEQIIKGAGLIGHGKDDLYWLTNKSCICGRVEDYNKLGKNDNTPSAACFYTGICFKQDMTTIQANKLKFENLLVYACCSGKIEESFFSPKYSIMNGFLDGYCSTYIGTTLMLFECKGIVYYYLNLINSGCKFGEIVYLLNEFLKNYNIFLDWTFFLNGNPYKEKNRTYQIGRDEINISNYCEKHYVFKIQEKLSFFVLEFKYIANRDVFSDFKNMFLRISITHEDEEKIHGIFRQVQGKWMLYLFSSKNINTGNISVDISFGNYNYFTQPIIFEHLLDINFQPSSKYKNIALNNTKNTLNLSNTLLKEMITLSTSKNKIYKKYDNLNHSYQGLQKIIIKSLMKKTHDNGYLWEDQTLNNGYHLVDYSYNSESYCPNCQRELIQINYEFLSNNMFKRIHNNCSKCGLISDVPNMNTIDVSFDLNKIRKELNEEIAITIINKTNLPLEGYVGFAMLWGKENHANYENNPQRIFIFPNTNKKLTYGFSFPSTTSPHQFWTRWFLMLNGELYVYHKIFWIEPNEKEIKTGKYESVIKK